MLYIFKEKSCLFLRFILFILFPICAFGQNPYYTGQVYDQATQKALAGVRIIVTDPAGNKAIGNTTSGSDGSYSFYMTGISGVKISASVNGYQGSEISYTAQQLKASNRRIPAIYLYPQKPMAVSINYTGYVYDQATQRTLAGARIIITDAETSNRVIGNTTSGSDGSYSFYMTGISGIRISVSVSGYQGSEISYTAQQLKGFERRIPVIYLYPQKPVAVSSNYTGYVYDQATQRALTGVRIIVADPASNKVIGNTTSGSDGSYSFYMSEVSGIRISASANGYQGSEISYTREQVRGFERRIPSIYLYPQKVIPPNTPVDQPREKFVSDKLAGLEIVPTRSAYDLIYYLNPGLEQKETLMSNTEIILPKLPYVSSDLKQENKKQFQDDKATDKITQDRLRDTIDKVYRILAEDLSAYKIRYIDVSPDSLKLMRTSLQADIHDYIEKIDRTSKLKAGEMIPLISNIGMEQQGIIDGRMINKERYEYLKMLWEDLSYLLKSNRNKILKFLIGEDRRTGYLEKTKPMAGPAAGEDMIVIEPTAINKGELGDDEVAVFGFVVWGEGITKTRDLDVNELRERFLINYFKPAYKKNRNTYIHCGKMANVAIADLTRARYGVEVYDTENKQYVEVLEPFFRTEEAFNDPKYDALLVSDYKEVKYIILHLKL